MVTLVMEELSGEELVPEGKLVMLMQSPVPLREVKMQPEQDEYTPGGRFPNPVE